MAATSKKRVTRICGSLIAVLFCLFALYIQLDSSRVILQLPQTDRLLNTQALRQKNQPHLSPLSVFKPGEKSLHPKWKSWKEMSDEQKQKALDEVGTSLKKYGDAIMAKGERGNIKHGSCDLHDIGGKTGHRLCGPVPEGPCTFFSFGINDDPSWDIDLASSWKCRGFAGDPTVQHPSHLHPLVTFHNLGATTVSPNEERLINKGGEEKWWETSMPRLKAFLNLDHVDIIKLGRCPAE